MGQPMVNPLGQPVPAADGIHTDDYDDRPVMIAGVLFAILVVLLLLILLLLMFLFSDGSGGGSDLFGNWGQGGKKTGSFANNEKVGGGKGDVSTNQKSDKSNDNGKGASNKKLANNTAGNQSKKTKAKDVGLQDRPSRPQPRQEALKQSSQATIASLGSKGGATFFGSSAEGTDFVYVIDVSGSMTGAGRLEKAMSELVRSVNLLPPKSYFGVVFYSSQMYVEKSFEFVKATDANKRRLAEYVKEVKAGGGTNPLEATKHAIDLEPDAVFLLSDGQFPFSMAGLITDYNKAEIPIHGISLGNPSSTLEEIADRNQGTYSIVP